MANLKEVKNRINSVVSTQQITKAMKMVAASKMRKAQDMILQLRPFAEKLTALQKNVAASVSEDAMVSAYTKEREPLKILIVVIASDRGLCGAFNSNTFKRTLSLINEEYQEQYRNNNVTVLPIGNKAFEFCRRRSLDMDPDYKDSLHELTFENISNVAEFLMESFTEGRFDRILLVYNEFKNAATQILRAEQYLPIIQDDLAEEGSGGYGVEYIYEPSKEELLADLIPRSLKIQLYRAILESNASEQGARMVAMDQATENAGELLQQLRLTYNRTRQASITREILEIVAGAEALKGQG